MLLLVLVLLLLLVLLLAPLLLLLVLLLLLMMQLLLGCSLCKRQKRTGRGRCCESTVPIMHALTLVTVCPYPLSVPHGLEQFILGHISLVSLHRMSPGMLWLLPGGRLP